jgi:hypothetical protein
VQLQIHHQRNVAAKQLNLRHLDCLQCVEHSANKKLVLDQEIHCHVFWSTQQMTCSHLMNAVVSISDGKSSSLSPSSPEGLLDADLSSFLSDFLNCIISEDCGLGFEASHIQVMLNIIAFQCENLCSHYQQ